MKYLDTLSSTCFAPNIVKTLRGRCLNVEQTILRSRAGKIGEMKCSIGGVVRFRKRDIVHLFSYSIPLYNFFVLYTNEPAIYLASDFPPLYAFVFAFLFCPALPA
jgi:hypothetical protein